MCSPSSSSPKCVWSSQMWRGASFYSLRMVGLLRYFRKHRMQPPPRALNAPPEKGRAKRSWGWCGRTMGCAPGHRLWRVGSWLGLGLCCASVLPRCEIWMGFCICFAWMRLLDCAFCCIFTCCPAKYIYQNSWKMWVVNPNSKFHIHICFILFKCWW